MTAELTRTAAPAASSPEWNHTDILDLDDFSVAEIETVLNLADRMREVLDRRIARVPALRGYTIVNPHATVTAQN